VAINPLNDFAIKVLCENPNYDIRPDGKIFTLITRTGKKSATNTWREQVPNAKADGYLRIKYDYRDLYLHRIIAQKFIGDLNGLQVNHIDGNPRNNHRNNLELVTASENLIHSYKMLGRRPNYGNSKISQEIAEFIRELHSKGILQKDLAKQFNISTGHVSEIISGKIWKAAANG
jgi:YesN/AraC family two-component response regulator